MCFANHTDEKWHFSTWGLWNQQQKQVPHFKWRIAAICRDRAHWHGLAALSIWWKIEQASQRRDQFSFPALEKREKGPACLGPVWWPQPHSRCPLCTVTTRPQGWRRITGPNPEQNEHNSHRQEESRVPRFNVHVTSPGTFSWSLVFQPPTFPKGLSPKSPWDKYSSHSRSPPQHPFMWDMRSDTLKTH